MALIRPCAAYPGGAFIRQALCLPLSSVEIPCNQRVNLVSEIVAEGVAPVIDNLTGYQVDIGARSGDAIGLAVADSLTVYPGVGDIAGVVVVKLKAERLRVELQALMPPAYPDLAVSLKILQSLSVLYFSARQDLKSLGKSLLHLLLHGLPYAGKSQTESGVVAAAGGYNLMGKGVSAAEKV